MSETLRQTQERKSRLKGLVCVAESCSEPVFTKSLCYRHYHRLRNKGDLTLAPPRTRGTTEFRFWSKVDKSGPNGCWLWTGTLDEAGYGKLNIKAKLFRAHRLSFQMHNPDTSIDGLLVRHMCNNPPCVNPAHLLPGTPQDNMDDRTRAGNVPINENCWATRHSDATIAEVRAATGTLLGLAKRFGISPSHVFNIRHYKTRPEPMKQEQASFAEVP